MQKSYLFSKFIQVITIIVDLLAVEVAGDQEWGKGIKNGVETNE